MQSKSPDRLRGIRFLAGLVIWAVTVVVIFLMTSSGGRWDGGGEGLWLELRMPRLVLGAVVGGQLSLAGLILQSLFRNPLAEPYILGVSSGASLGTVVWLLFISSWVSLPFGIELAGALGAGLAVWMVIRIGRMCGLTSSPAFVLVGIAVGAGLHALSAFFLVQADPNRIRDALVWLMGSLAYKSWVSVWMTLPVLMICSVVTVIYSRGLDLLLLGDEQAHYLGLDVRRMHILYLLMAVILAGSATAAVGVVGFVGLIAPNLVRMNFSLSHRYLVLLSLVAGAVLVPTADLLTRYLAPDREIPIGILTAIAGCFFFLLLLRRK